jgi:hypothetical protein
MVSIPYLLGHLNEKCQCTSSAEIGEPCNFTGNAFCGGSFFNTGGIGFLGFDGVYDIDNILIPKP